MKASVLAVFLFYLSSLAFAQSQLAPNPACPNNTPYCRGWVSDLIPGSGLTPSVIGFHEGTLYGDIAVAAGAACPLNSAQNPQNSTTTLCFYTSTSFSPEAWQYLTSWSVPNQTTEPTTGISAIEIVFPSGSCSGYSYVYTAGWGSPPQYASGKHILRAGPNWQFSDKGSANLPSLPPDTLARAASFATADQDGQTVLFYTNYNDHTYNPGDNPPPGGMEWTSTDCGDTWSLTFTFGGREVHAINVDPANSSNVYAVIDTECFQEPNGGPLVCPADNPPDAKRGLWISTNGGSTFTQVAHADENHVPINFVFPSVSNDLFLELDSDPGGPLLSWDSVNGLQPTGPWPLTTPPWSGGTGAGIALTAEQNILTAAEASRGGIWYFAPPLYNIPTLLEDLLPPIQSITADGTKATVVTFDPHGIEPTDGIVQISGATPASLDADFATPTVVNPTTFTYPSSVAPPASCQASATVSCGFVAKFVGFVNRTVEANAGPPNNTTYLYNTVTRMVKPRFVAKLGGFAASSGVGQWTYLDASQHVHNFYGCCGTYGSADVTAVTGAPPAIAGSGLSAFLDSGGGQHWTYVDTNQHLHNLWWSDGTYGNHDVTAILGSPLVVLGSNIAGFADSFGGQHWTYFDSNYHVHNIWWYNGAYGGDEDVTAATGAPPAVPGSALAGFGDPSGGQHWIYIDANNHLHDSHWNNGSYGDEDLTATTFAPEAVSGSSVSGFADSSGGLHWTFLDGNEHVHNIWAANGSGADVDVTSATGAPASVPGSSLAGFGDPNGGQHWVYLDSSLHLHNLRWNSGSYGNDDLTEITGASPAVAGSGVMGFANSSGTLYWTYLDINDHLHNLSLVNGVYGNDDVTALTSTPAAH